LDFALDTTDEVPPRSNEVTYFEFIDAQIRKERQNEILLGMKTGRDIDKEKVLELLTWLEEYFHDDGKKR
jgi:hypothetical protein